MISSGLSGDTVTSSGQSWTSGGTTTVDGNVYNLYTNGTASLLIDTEIGTQTIS